MRIIAVSTENNTIRETFFKTLFGEGDGFLAFAFKGKDDKEFGNKFFKYPEDLPAALDWINVHLNGKNLYFCPHLFSKPIRQKQYAIFCPVVWADIDENSDPSKISPQPSILVQSSPGRYQGYWILDKPANPPQAEDASRKLAYNIKADASGWDLTQLLRIPLTYNVKQDYSDNGIVIVGIDEYHPKKTYVLEDFLNLEDAPEFAKSDVPYPAEEVAKLDADALLSKHRRNLLPIIFELYTTSPDSDWSKPLWSLQCMLIEAGLSLAETFVIAWNSACNKYKRDGRSEQDLWREVCKAQVMVDLKKDEESQSITIDNLLTDKEKKHVETLPETFVERYIEWAKTRSDASWEYHEAGAFTILSCLLAESVHLPTSFGNIVPNLWFMILGDSTVTRKTTAMEMAMDLLFLVYEDCVLATDGSIEGVLTSLSNRSEKSSLFWRDEFSGMLDSIRRKDYYSGMLEALTKLYDGKYQKRVLRKETIEIRDPVFVMFCGGIKSRILELVDIEYVLSGFLPRFVYIISDQNLQMGNYRRIGPASAKVQDMSEKLFKELSALQSDFNIQITIKVGNQQTTQKRVVRAELTQDAWDRYGELEEHLVEAGVKSDRPELFTPTMDRLAKSILKGAVLVAASRQKPVGGVITVEVDDILRVAARAERWKKHSTYVVENAGKGSSEKRMDQAMILIKSGKNSRSALMRSMHLNARETDLILDTLEQRGMVTRTKSGKKEKLFPTGA